MTNEDGNNDGMPGTHAHGMRYAITDRRLYSGSDAERRAALVAQAARLALAGVEYLQIREKDLCAEDLLELTAAIRDAAANGAGTRVLLNGPAKIAERAGVGLHLSASMARQRPFGAVSVSCHSAEDVANARGFAEVLLFAPVFEKRVAGETIQQGTGLAALAEACRVAGGVPVFALGGVTDANAAACLAAGASGVAGIRMFLR